MEKIRKSTFLIGLNDKDTKKQEVSTEKALEIIVDIFGGYYDGATISAARGMWRGAWEESVRVEVLFSDEVKDATICDYLKKALNQEAIYLEVAEVAAAFM